MVNSSQCATFHAALAVLQSIDRLQALARTGPVDPERWEEAKMVLSGMCAELGALVKFLNDDEHTIAKNWKASPADPRQMVVVSIAQTAFAIQSEIIKWCLRSERLGFVTEPLAIPPSPPSPLGWAVPENVAKTDWVPIAHAISKVPQIDATAWCRYLRAAYPGCQSTSSNGASSPSENSGQDDIPFLFRDDGDFFTIRAFGETATVKKTVGGRYVFRLLQTPHVRVSACQLTGEPGNDDSGQTDVSEQRDTIKSCNLELAALRKEQSQLNCDDPCEAVIFKETQEKIDQIKAEIKRRVGLGGRPRTEKPDKARIRVQKAIMNKDPKKGFVARCEVAGLKRLAGHLRDSITTGSHCAYDPALSDQPDWKFF